MANLRHKSSSLVCVKVFLWGTAFAALTMAATSSTAADAPFPSKPLRIIVTFPAGGSYDLVARTVAQRMLLGQNVIVENRPGGNSVIGIEIAARAPADGTDVGAGRAPHESYGP